MKKQRLKAYFKLGVLLFGTAILITNCQKEDLTSFENQNPTKASYKVTSLQNLNELKPIIKNIKQIKTKTSAYNRGFENFLPMSNIDPTKVIQYTDETGYSTYTFKIISEDENSINFENLHLLETELGYIGYILNYEPDENWYESHLIYQHGEYILDMNDYVGNITKYSLERDIIWSTDQNIVPPSSTSRGGQFIEECTVSVEMICTYDIHGPGNYYRCEALEMVEVVRCQSVWSGGGGGAVNNPGDGDIGGGGGGGTGNSSPCHTTGTSIIDDQPIASINGDCAPNESNGVIPPRQETTIHKNCKELNLLTSHKTYNSPNPYIQNNHPNNPNELNSNTRLAISSVQNSLDSNLEHGFGFYNRGNFLDHGPYAHHIPPQYERKVLFPGHPFQYGTVHSHPNDGTTIPMFSHEDIYSLLNLKNNYTLDLLNDNNPSGVNLFVSVLVAKQEGQTKTYALKIDDISKLQNLQALRQSENWNYFGEKLLDRYMKQANGVHGTIVQYQKTLLEFLHNFDLGISLYEIETENSGPSSITQNWVRLTLNSTSPNGIKKQSCNN